MCKTVSYSETVNFDKLPQKLSNQFKLFSGPNKHNSAVTCLQFNSKFVITSSDDGTVKLWDVKTGKNLIKALEILLGWIYRDSPDSTVFAPSGNRTIGKTVLIGD